MQQDQQDQQDQDTSTDQPTGPFRIESHDGTGWQYDGTADTIGGARRFHARATMAGDSEQTLLPRRIIDVPTNTVVDPAELPA